MLLEFEYQGLTMQRQQQREILSLPITKASKLYFCLLRQIELKKNKQTLKKMEQFGM